MPTFDINTMAFYVIPQNSVLIHTVTQCYNTGQLQNGTSQNGMLCNGILQNRSDKMVQRYKMLNGTKWYITKPYSYQTVRRRTVSYKTGQYHHEIF
jgi:hypothetical protein